jgi:hypothetical protein
VRAEPGPPPGPTRGRLPDPGWLGLMGMYDGVARIVVVFLPVALLAGWALARCRCLRGTASTRAWRLSLAEVGIVYLTLPAVWITMLPGPHAGHDPSRLSLVPLRDVDTMSTFQIGGNLLLLAALGFLAPLRLAALASIPRILVVAATCSASIEAAQYLLPLDRVASIDDVLLNTAGAGLAALASRPLWRMRSQPIAEPDLRSPRHRTIAK